MGDPFLFVGSMLFVALGIVAYINPNALWNIYNKDRRWRRNNPEQPPQWEKRAKRHAMGYIVVGIGLFVLMIVLS